MFDKKKMFEAYGNTAIDILTHEIYEPLVLGHEIIGSYGPEKAVALGVIFREKEDFGVIAIKSHVFEFYLHKKQSEVLEILKELEDEHMAIEIIDFKGGEFFLKINYRTFFIKTLEAVGIEDADEEIGE